MAIRLCTVEALANEVGGRKAALALLAEQGIRVINDSFDLNRLTASYNEPKWLRNRRNDWSLSHSMGLGAVKYLLDPLKVNIVQHECRGAQWLMLEGPTRKRQYMKMYYTGKLVNLKTPSASFVVRNFLREDRPDYYLLISFDGPHMWCVPTRKLVLMWRKLHEEQKVSTSIDGYSIPAEHVEHEFGCLNVAVQTVNDPLLVSDIKHLGLA